MRRIMREREDHNEGVKHATVQDIQKPAHARKKYEDKDHNEGVKHAAVQDVQKPEHAHNYEGNIYIYLFTARRPKGFYNFFWNYFMIRYDSEHTLNEGEHLYSKKTGPHGWYKKIREMLTARKAD